MRVALRAGFLVLVVIGCSEHSTVYELVTINGNSSGAGGAASANGGAAAADSGASRGTTSGESAQGGDASMSMGGVAVGGSLGGDASGENAAGGIAAGVAGQPSADAGDAGAGGVACGTPVANVPADCHATIACVGTSVVDQNNVPAPTNPCVEGTCNSAGVPGTAPAPAETPCRAAGGGILCDGAGKCVPCLRQSDCKAGQVCSADHHCVVGACTDVDCGGTCPACQNGKKCLADADCLSFACDSVSLTCVTPQCQDHRQDGVETDADCGGSFCPPCVLGKSCTVDTDCTTLACDGIKLVCVGSPCADHRVDGNETDIDCGGWACNSCNVGQKCGNNLDCISGHFCNAQKICQ